MLFAFAGSDEFAKDCRIEKFWAESLVGGSLRKVFFATDSPKEESSLVASVAQALTPSFFEPAASVLIRHSEFMTAEEQRNLASLLADLSKGGSFQGNLAIDFFKPDKKSALWKFLVKQGVVENFEAPSKYGNAIQKWIMEMVQKSFQKKINSDAALYIADAIDADTKRIYSEIKKIFLYDGSIQEINVQHCQLFIKQNREINAYELQDFFGFRNLRAFLPKFRRILAEEGDEAFMPVVGALRSHCLNLLHIQAMKAKGIPEYDISARVLPPNQAFLYRKNRLPEQSSCWLPGSLQKTILRLDEISYGKKIGYYRDLPSFELAICGLIA
jgi:DNA polymerase III delta subunit